MLWVISITLLRRSCTASLHYLSWLLSLPSWALQTAKGKSFLVLAKEARTEIRKVVWPTRQETTQTTLIVVAVVLVMALLLWGLDSLLGWAVSLIVG